MSYFGDFELEQLLPILSLPYRAGVWISHIDDAPGTQRDDEQEQAALERALKRVDREADKASFVHAVVGEILDHRGEWSAWGAQSGSVLDDVPVAIRRIKAQLPADEVAQYQKLVFGVAKAVAMAASEMMTPDDPIKGAMGGSLLRKLGELLPWGGEEPLPQNISETEKKALRELLHCLKA